MVLYPLVEPQPVIRPPFSQGTFNRRAENMRQPSPYSFNYQEPLREEHTLSRQQLRRKAMQSRRKGNRKSPSRRPHRRVPYQYYPPSPQYKPPTSSEDEDREIPREKQLVRIPQGDSSDEEVPELVPDNQEEYQTPPERTASPLNLARQHAEIEKQLDKALEEALNQNPLPGTSGNRQGGGDRETTPSGTATVPRAPLNMAEENWYLEPNKVQFMDGPDTFRANVGRHRVPPLRLLRAKTFPHLVFADPPASPDGKEDSQGQRQERAATSPPEATQGPAQKQQQQQLQQQKKKAPVATPDSTSTTVDMEPSLEFNEPPPVALEPTVVVVPHPGAPAPPPKPQDSDCEIVDDPAVVAYKPKKDWAKKRMQQTKKTLVLHLPRCDAPPSKKEEAGAAQREAPPAPQNGEDPGAEKECDKDSGSESMDELN